MAEPAVKPGVQVHHKKERDRDGGNRTEGRSGRPPAGSGKFVLALSDKAPAIIDQYPGAPDRNERVDKLLYDLGNGGRHHIRKSLEETAEDAGDRKDQDHRCQDAEPVLGVFHIHHIFRDDSGKQIGDQRQDSAGNDGETHGTQEDLVRVAHLSLLDSFTHQAGDGKRQTEGRDHQYDGIDLIRCRIIAVSHIPENAVERDPVDQADDLGDNRSSREDRSLNQNVLRGVDPRFILLSFLRCGSICLFRSVLLFQIGHVITSRFLPVQS